MPAGLRLCTLAVLLLTVIFFCSLIAKGEPRRAGRDLHAKESMQRFQTKQSWETLRIPLRNSPAKYMQVVCVCVCV